MFWMWTLMDHIKFWVLSALLSLFGYATYAQKLWGGWMVRLHARSSTLCGLLFRDCCRCEAVRRHGALPLPFCQACVRCARASRYPAALRSCCLQ